MMQHFQNSLHFRKLQSTKLPVFSVEQIAPATRKQWRKYRQSSKIIRQFLYIQQPNLIRGYGCIFLPQNPNFNISLT
jgi:hypothetical protein